MRKLQRALLLTIVICALTAFVTASTATLTVPSYAYPSASARQFTPTGDPIDVPGPPGTPYSPPRA